MTGAGSSDDFGYRAIMDPNLDPKVSVGFASEQGPRKRNEDFVAAVIGGAPPDERRDIAVAIADGMGGAKGGRVAAETAVRGFLDGLWDVPQTMDVRRAGARILSSLNSWMHAQGRQDPNLAGMGCAFTALVLRGRVAHLLHIGDTRAYRLSGDRLLRLSEDHVRQGGGRPGLLNRALGVEAEARLDYAAAPIALYDRFLLCTDGVHAALSDDSIAGVLRTRSAPAEASRSLVEAALAAGSADNCTALVMDVVGLPSGRSTDVGRALMELPLKPTPRGGETIDGFALEALISDGPHSRIFAAVDELDGGDVALKFPKPQVGAVASHHAAFVREAWVGARVHCPFLVRNIELAPGRQTCLYAVTPLYRGELLEVRLRRRPAIGLEEGRSIAVKLAHAIAALHRADIIHRDIKPDNVILEADGSLKLLDLGVVRLPGLEDLPGSEIPGTAAYMAPEMFAGERGNAVTDIFALGVTMFRAFSGEFPYGNQGATARARLEWPRDLSSLRPDLPAWLQEVIARAIAPDPGARFGDIAELGQEMEAGPAAGLRWASESPTFYQRHRLRVWQALAALLGLGLAASLLLR
ncbi:MAG TPA: protein kinase [Caulobacteraceae bacterium]|nr:protein kinase [Caulobacteraceae bacterium]